MTSLGEWRRGVASFFRDGSLWRRDVVVREEHLKPAYRSWESFSDHLPWLDLAGDYVLLEDGRNLASVLELRAAALRNTGRVAQPPPPAGGAAADALFPRLYNPVLHMYIFPHLVGEEGLPVPGYSTAFRLYERDHFAQPGEETSP